MAPSPAPSSDGGTGAGALDLGLPRRLLTGQERLTAPQALMAGGACALLGTFCSCVLCAYFATLIRHAPAAPVCDRHLELPPPAPEAQAQQRLEPLALPSSTTPAQQAARAAGAAGPGLRYAPPSREPAMYGKVQEKTIWAYWYHPKDCPNSKRCVLPPLVQLCSETVRKNRGTFDYKIMHADEIFNYVSRMEMPIHFTTMRPAIQKDALMNALLSRYGGVALDISSILLRPLDEYWEEMVSSGATFRGYMYRANGMKWGNSENMAVWFLMSRREGVSATAVRNQVLGMGDYKLPPCKEQNGYHNPYFAMGDQTLTPILSMFNYSLPRCTNDPTVGPPWSWKDMCPEFEFPRWNDNMPGPERNDAKILLREPREGPQLPFAFTDDFSMGAWRVNSEKLVNCTGVWPCKTQRDCWEKVFIPRYHSRTGPGGSRVLEFVKLFNSGGRLKELSREELLSDKDAFLFHWLRLAGVEGLDD